jgi:exonuclease III
MKIMTLNLNFYKRKHGPWPVRRELIVFAIRQHAPDIVAFQAVRADRASEEGKDQAAQLAERLPEYKHVVFRAAVRRADGSQDGSALLSRLPFEHVDRHGLSLGAEPHEAECTGQTNRLCVGQRPHTLTQRCRFGEGTAEHRWSASLRSSWTRYHAGVENLQSTL